MSTPINEETRFWRRILFSQIGRKVLTGITGLGLTLFVLVHMIGNLAYFTGNDTYNTYSHFLLSLGPLLYIIEAGLVVFVLLHAYLGISIYLGKRKARPEAYERYKSVGGPSKQSFSSRSMIVTGVVLLVFLVVHLKSFKFGTFYNTEIGGESIRDLARLVTEKFSSPWYTFGYLGVMILLGFHLRHGVWSAFQSLGATNPRWTPLIYSLGAILAVLIAVGFFVLPLWIFFTGGNV